MVRKRRRKKLRIDTSEKGLRSLMLQNTPRRVPYAVKKEGSKLIYYFDFAGAKKNKIKVSVRGKKLKVFTKLHGIRYFRVLNLPKEPKSVMKKDFRNGILQVEVLL